jgi:Zn-dependent protease
MKTESMNKNRTSNHLVLFEINNPDSEKSDVVKNISFLVISLFVFAGTGLFQYSLKELFVLVMVLFFHECGHFAAMKIFKYSNVKMFFLPFIGAAVSGKEETPFSSKKIIVSLAGPLPGIVIAFILSVIYAYTKEKTYHDFALMFLIINAFNLLPLFPLDGGRFFNEIIFSRSYTIELIFKLVTSVIFIVLVISIKSWILIIIPIAVLISLKSSYVTFKAAKPIRDNLKKEDIPNLHLDEEMVETIRKNLPISSEKTLKSISSDVSATWQRIFHVSPTKSKILLFVLTYAFALTIGVISFFTLMAVNELNKYDTKISNAYNQDGKFIHIQQIYRDSILTSKIELDEYGTYHGQACYYSEKDGKISSIGYFNNGKWDGEWNTYDKDSSIIQVCIFDKGKFVMEKKLENGSWKIRKWEDLSRLEKLNYSSHEKGKPERSKVLIN